jgi:hypothetical protein
MYTNESLVPESIPLDVEIAVAKLKNYKSPGSSNSGRTDSSRR